MDKILKKIKLNNIFNGFVIGAGYFLVVASSYMYGRNSFLQKILRNMHDTGNTTITVCNGKNREEAVVIHMFKDGNDN